MSPIPTLITSSRRKCLHRSYQIPQAHSQSQPPLPLPLSNCYHSTQTRTQCRVRNDVTVGGDWPESTYQPNRHDQILLDRKYYNADHNRRKVLERGPGVVNDQLGECKGFSVTLPLFLCTMQRTRTAVPSVNALQPVMPEVDILAPLTRLRVNTFVAQATLKTNVHIQSAKPARVMPRDDTFHSIFHWVAICKAASIFTRLQTDFHDDSNVTSISLSYLIWSYLIFGAGLPHTLRVIVLDDLESIKAKQINYPWDLFKEMHKTQTKYAS